MSEPVLNSTLLATFLTVAESGGALPASRRLGLTQPAVTARVLQLEESLAAPLFLRSPRGMTLTPRGRRLLDYARRSAELLREAAEAVGSPAAAPAGPLTLAASTTPATHVLPALLARYRTAASAGSPDPLVGLTLRVGNTDQVIGWVRDGTAPLGLVEGRPKAAGVHLTHFMDDELLPVYAPAAMDAATRKRIEAMRKPADLAGTTLLWREEGSGTRRLVETALDRLNVPPAAWSEGAQIGGGSAAIKAAALAGLGAAFLPRCAIAAELKSGELRQIPVPALRIKRAFRWAACGPTPVGPAAAFKRFADRNVPA